MNKILCHKNLKTSQYYAKVLVKKVSIEIKFLRDKFKINRYKLLNTLVKTLDTTIPITINSAESIRQILEESPK